MPSPTCRTVPTSARSVSTSYSSICFRRIEVISSGRSFKALPFIADQGCSSGSSDEFAAQSLEAAADARVHAQRAGREDDAPDQLRVDGARRLNGAPRGFLDLSDDVPSIGIRELEGGRQLDVEHLLLRGVERAELARDLLD